jgi:hypothetical protein
MALAALWVVFTPAQLIPQTMSVDYQTLPHLQTAPVILWAQPGEPVRVELRVPMALVNTLLAEERSSEIIDLRMPEALLEHLDGAGRVSGEISVAPH